MRGQMSLEFLFVLSVYSLFLFVMISALNYSKYLERMDEQEFMLKIKSLQLIEAQRTINNKYTDIKLPLEDCLISESPTNTSIICVRGNVTKSLLVPISRQEGMLLIVYKPLS
ncbi:MAG: hypothetical protein NZ903_02550 [Candidatus Micrarchaeota archaeon]|nr:hypothetical protein [Candidatus Micrarchaeota archaeon]